MNDYSNSPISIKVAATPEELEAVYRFRYKVYFEEMRINESYADHCIKQIVDPLDEPKAVILVASKGGEVIGTSRFNLVRDGAVGPYREYYRLNNEPLAILHYATISTRTMIHPAFRRTTLAARMCCKQFELGLELGIKVDFCDCSPANAPFFKGLGYHVHINDFVHPEFGAGSVMRLDLDDLPHLVSVRSPFRRALAYWQRREEEHHTLALCV